MTRWLIKIKKRYETIIKLKLYSGRKVRITRDRKALPNTPKQEGHF